MCRSIVSRKDFSRIICTTIVLERDFVIGLCGLTSHDLAEIAAERTKRGRFTMFSVLCVCSVGYFFTVCRLPLGVSSVLVLCIRFEEGQLYDMVILVSSTPLRWVPPLPHRFLLTYRRNSTFFFIQTPRRCHGNPASRSEKRRFLFAFKSNYDRRNDKVALRREKNKNRRKYAFARFFFFIDCVGEKMEKRQPQRRTNGQWIVKFYFTRVTLCIPFWTRPFLNNLWQASEHFSFL